MLLVFWVFILQDSSLHLNIRVPFVSDFIGTNPMEIIEDYRRYSGCGEEGVGGLY